MCHTWSLERNIDSVLLLTGCYYCSSTSVHPPPTFNDRRMEEVRLASRRWVGDSSPLVLPLARVCRAERVRRGLGEGKRG